jgi:opacity protein-like surface antigen
MIKFFPFFLFCLGFSFRAEAQQSKFFVFAKVQKHWGTNMTDFNPSSTFNGGFKTNSVAMGSGNELNAGLGYFFTNIFGLDLSAVYHQGDQFAINKSTALTSNGGLSTEQSFFKTNYVCLQPSFILNFELSKKVAVYIKSGLVIPVYLNTNYSYQLNTDAYNYNISSKFNLGFNGMVGLAYKLSSKLFVTFEMEEWNLASRFDKATAVDKTVASDFVFVDKFDPAIATAALSFPVPFNKIGFNLGLRYRF